MRGLRDTSGSRKKRFSFMVYMSGLADLLIGITSNLCNYPDFYIRLMYNNVRFRHVDNNGDGCTSICGVLKRTIVVIAKIWTILYG